MSSSSSSPSGGAGFVAFGRPFLLREVFADPIDIGEDGPVRARIGRPQVNDVTEQNLAGQELVTPDDDGLNGERAFAQARDHRLAAGLDALGDRDFALAGQKLDRAHLAQVHAHRIVGAVGRLLGGSLAHRDRMALGGLDEVIAVGFLPSASACCPSSPSSDSTTLIPIAESWPSTSSICSEEKSLEGKPLFNSPCVT